MITAPQIRAARALLGWSAAELAKQARVSWSTVQRAEAAEGTPNVQVRNLAAIEAAGVIHRSRRYA